MKQFPPGPELDAIVAKVIGGKPTVACCPVPRPSGGFDEIPIYECYSQDFAACEPALEWLNKNGHLIHQTSQRGETFQHAIALAVFAVGVAKGIVDEAGESK